MAKSKVTRTYGPIHFEDLDPHRFEDLVRELIYDYKDWQSIEATGRSGSDDGFDIRAYEKVINNSDTEEDEDAPDKVHPMEGNLWMIQGKREKEIGPKKVKSIVAEINEEDPPDGYILAASANFSKESYDVFREELRKKGVMEFYLWGKAELEDMLHLPKNDRILFTFFGISLISKRRSRATEVRSTINIKNKLYRALGEGHSFNQSILIRDLKDTHYPYESEYKDFKKRPRWKEYIAFGYHPLGVRVHGREYFAYIDTEKKESDFTKEVDLISRQVEDGDDRQKRIEIRENVEGVWGFFPRANQGYFFIDGLVEYADIAVVDDKGDVLYKFPHIYVDFVGDRGPFAWFINTLEIGEKTIRLTEDYKRIKVFPDNFSKPTIGKIRKDKTITFDPATLEEFKKYDRVNVLYDSDGRYAFLTPKDVIQVAGAGEGSEEVFIQIKYRFKTRVKDYLKKIRDMFGSRRDMQQQLGREFRDDEEINVYEFKRYYKWDIEERSS
jgi:Restriction endonuclease